MNHDSDSLDHRLLALLHAVRDDHDEQARTALNELLRSDPATRAAMARLLVDEQALIHRLRDEGIVSLLEPAPSPRPAKGPRVPRWRSWRPLTSAAAGVVLGTLSTSLVYGFVTQRIPDVRTIPLPVFDPGLEGVAPLDDGLPDEPGSWGVDSAAFVTTENGSSPKDGSRMLRLEPIPKEKEVKNHTSRVYQVLDLSSLPVGGVANGDEVEVTASFTTAGVGTNSRYLIRAVALEETPEEAMDNFWSKTENDDVISVSQRFDAVPGDESWQTFSLKLPLQPGAHTLVLILGAVPPSDPAVPAAVHYLDDVQVSLLKVVPASAKSSD
jgi:hypothetical protein